jgi:hypothetical protein
LRDYWDHLGSIHKIELRVEVHVGTYPKKDKAISAPVALEIDLRDTCILQTPDGRASSYVRHRDKIYFVWSGSRGHANNHLPVPADLATAKVLSARGDPCHFLVDHQSVYREGVRVKGLAPDVFRVHNPIFAGNASAVLTPYRGAKVLHPSHFDVIDAGKQYLFESRASPAASRWGTRGTTSTAIGYAAVQARPTQVSSRPASALKP